MRLDQLPPDLQAAVHAALEKKAGHVTVLDLRKLGAFTDFFVICTAFSQPQIRAIRDIVEEHLERRGRRLARREGARHAEWVLLDYGSFIIHVFTERARLYYDLDRLWRTAPRLDVTPEPSAGLRHPAASGDRPS